MGNLYGPMALNVRLEFPLRRKSRKRTNKKNKEIEKSKGRRVRVDGSSQRFPGAETGTGTVGADVFHEPKPRVKPLKL